MGKHINISKDINTSMECMYKDIMSKAYMPCNTWTQDPI